MVLELVGHPGVVDEGLRMTAPEGTYLEIGNINVGWKAEFDPSWIIFGNRRIIGLAHYEAEHLRGALDLMRRTLDQVPVGARGLPQVPARADQRGLRPAGQGPRHPRGDRAELRPRPGEIPQWPSRSWAKHVADVLRRNGIRLFATVPDYIVSHVLDELWADPECRVVTTTREEEAVGLLSGAWLAGHRGALLMQNSGLGNCTNALASLNMASMIPMVLVMSHRGDLGEFNPAQVPMGRAVTHILDALGIRWIRPTSIAELEQQTDGLVKLCYVSAQPVAIVLPSELTGGKRG